MTITNVICPIMVYMDRFFIGALVLVTAVACYATPYEMVSRIGIVAGALGSVVFPAYASVYIKDRTSLLKILMCAWRYLLWAIFIPVLLVIALAYEGLAIWLNHDFAMHSATILRWLAAGVFENSFAQIIFAVVQAAGRPDITAKLPLVELTIYLPALVWVLNRYGTIGAAVVGTVRVLIDGILQMLVSARLVPEIRPTLSSLSMVILASSGCFLAIVLIESFGVKIAISAAAALLIAVSAWRGMEMTQRIKQLSASPSI